jgi:hypothetical protein
MNLWATSVATAACVVAMQAHASTWSIATEAGTSFEAAAAEQVDPLVLGMTSVTAQPGDQGCVDIGEPFNCFALRSDGESLATDRAVAESEPSIYASMLAGLTALGLLGLRSR